MAKETTPAAPATQQQKVTALQKMETAMQQAGSLRAALSLDFVQQRFMSNFMATTGIKDKAVAERRFQMVLFDYMEICNEKDLLKAENMSHLAALVKIGTMGGIPLRDDKIYVMPGKNNTVKVQTSPAAKREMMEMMDTIKDVPEPQVVMVGDLFVFDKLNNIIKQHETTKDSKTEQKMENVFASYQRIKYKDGSIVDIVVPVEDLRKAMAKSKAQNDGLWQNFLLEACKKVATNRAYRKEHRYAQGVEVVGAFDTDDEDEEKDKDNPNIVRPSMTTTAGGDTVDRGSGEVFDSSAPAKKEGIQDAEVVPDTPKPRNFMED